MATRDVMITISVKKKIGTTLTIDKHHSRRSLLKFVKHRKTQPSQ